MAIESFTNGNPATPAPTAGTIVTALFLRALAIIKDIFAKTVNACEYNSGVFNAATLNAAIAAIGSDYRVLFLPQGSWTIDADVDFPDNIRVELDFYATLVQSGSHTVRFRHRLKLKGLAHYFQGAVGFIIMDGGSQKALAPDHFGASPALSDNTDAINACFACASASTSPGRPGRVEIPGNTYTVTGTITNPQRIIVIEGNGADKSTFRHNPSTFSDLWVGDTLGEGFCVVKNLCLRGSGYLTSKTRYLLNFGNFNENCIIENVQLRDSVGFIKINNGYLSTIRNLNCQASTPNAAAAGISNSEWAQVWGDGHAPIHLRGMNAAVLDQLHLYRIGSEVVGGVTPSSPILLEATQVLPIRALKVEGSTTFTDGSTYNIRQKSILIANSVSGLQIDGWYNEANFSTEHLFHAKGTTQAELRGLTVYNSDCDSAMIHSESVLDVRVRSGHAYKFRCPKLFKVVQSGFSVQGIIEFENFMVSPGDIFTDPALSSDAENVNDTYGTGAANLAGIADEDELIYSTKRLYTPKRNAGLVVTAGSNPTYTGVGVATGHCIQITSGTFFNEAGRLVTVKRPTGNNLANNLAVFRLRPPTASRYYRLFIGEAGGPYLVESATAFANDLGNWIAQFRTNGSTQIVRYSDGTTAGLDADPYNPRLSIIGSYLPNQTNLLFYATSTPTVGQFLKGDRYRNPNAGVDQAGEVLCTTAGSPGTWTSQFTLSQRIPRVLDSQFTQVGNTLTGEDDLLVSPIDAGRLSADKDYLRSSFWFEFAANTNNKRVRIYFGNHLIFDSGVKAFNGSSARVDVIVQRMGAATQRASVLWASSDTLLLSSALTSNPTQTLSGALNLKATGEAVATDDIINRGVVTEFFPAAKKAFLRPYKPLKLAEFRGSLLPAAFSN